jgi:two-component system, OmpR family, response regulator
LDRTQLRSVLYVDDEPDIREMAQLALTFDDDLDLQTCESGAMALELLAELPADLVILDMMMPGLDGPATLRRMRADPKLSRIPVIFMAAKTMPNETARFRQLGVVGVIAKPFDPMLLHEQVFSLWERAAGV